MIVTFGMAERAVPARTPTRPPIQDTLWAAGWGCGPAPRQNQ